MRRIAVMTAAVATVAWLALAGTARADVYDDNLATATRTAGDIYVFARGPDGAVLERHWTGSAYSDWASLGGNATSGPAAVSYNGAIHVFVRGTDGAIYENVQQGNGWSGWASLSGYATSAPSAVLRRGAAGYLDLAVKGGDNAIWFESFIPGTGWSGWSSLGGNLTTAPSLNSQADGIVNVFSRGDDGTMFQKYWDGSAWSDWFTLGGGLAGGPQLISRAPGQIEVYVRGAANATYTRHWDAAGWTPWAQLDATPVDSVPVPVSDAYDRTTLFARRGTSMLSKSWSASGGWGQWTDMGPIAVPAPPAPATPAPPASNGEVGLETGVRCTPPGGKLRVSIKVRKPKGKAKPRVSKIVFYTKGKGRRIRTDRKAPFTVHITVNRPAGSTGRVYARVYYRRSAHGALHHKTVSRRFVMCG